MPGGGHPVTRLTKYIPLFILARPRSTGPHTTRQEFHRHPSPERSSPSRRSHRRRRQFQKPLRICRRPFKCARKRQVTLDAPEARVPLVEDGVDAAEEDTAQDVKVLVAARLDAAVGGAVAEVLESKVRGFDVEEGVADGEGDFGESREVGRGREDPALLRGAFSGAGDGAVDLLAQGIGY